MHPVWKDYFADLGTGDSAPFRIVCDTLGETVYTGKAYRRPDATNIETRVNDIVADYLSHNLPTISDGVFTSLAFLQFSVEKDTGTQWQNVATEDFANDWSYNYGYDIATDGLSAPINGRIDPRMPLVMSIYEASTVRMDVYRKDGTHSSQMVAVERSNDFNADYNNDYSHENTGPDSGTIMFDLSQWSNVDHVEIAGQTFTVSEGCNRYALYYVNAHGGWDFLVIEGATRWRDELTRHTQEHEYDNRSAQNRSKSDRVIELARMAEIHTGWMTDEQSLRMHHLLNSPLVYLYDMESADFIPLVLTDTTTEYKTYHSLGNRMVNYTINAEVAHHMTRR